MLVLIFEIIAIVLVTSRIVDLVEDKGHPSLAFKIAAPAAWIAGELFGYVMGMAIIGTSLAEVVAPDADLRSGNAMFLLLLFRAAGALAGAGIVYLVARRLPAAVTEDPSIG